MNVETQRIFLTLHMRFLYISLWGFVRFALKLFFRKREIVNNPKSSFNSTIFVSNHAASFMDPIVIACFNRPIVFFMTRSDVFTPFAKPFLHGMHMLPIYRQQDGVNTKEKNQEVFRKCTEVLLSKRSPLIFGEGFTDDVFIRRLKPVKKGAARIAFTALEACNWEKEISIAAIGCNYTEPNKFRSEILISNGEPILLNDFRQAYEENPDKVVTEVTRLIEKQMKDQITHVEDENLAPVHERLMIITGKGMSATDESSEFTLKQRWIFSKQLAAKFNAVNADDTTLNKLNQRATNLLNQLEKEGLQPEDIDHAQESNYLVKKYFKLLCLFPFAFLGFVHCFIPYYFVKSWVEKTFKRAVFWGSTKVIVGLFAFGIINIPIVWLLFSFAGNYSWFGWIYYVLIGFFWVAFGDFRLTYRLILRAKKVKRNSKVWSEEKQQLTDSIINWMNS